MAQAQTAWRCSQCGAINEPGSRACHECGKWPSLFDLQNDIEELPGELDEVRQTVFEPELFEPDTYEPPPPETGLPVPETFEQEAEVEEDESEEGRSRFPRWAITAVWVIGLIVWFVANALSDRG